MSEPTAPLRLAATELVRLRASVRRFHEEVRTSVGTLLERARGEGRPELANRPGAWGAGDLSYAIDEPAEHALAAFGAELGRERPTLVVSEGPGVQRFGDGAPGRSGLRVIVDPIDGTRGLMHDMRSAWVLTGVAPDRGEGTRLSDVELAVQTELPTTSAAVYQVLSAVRGCGATIARHDVATGRLLEERALVVPEGLPLDNGYFPFTRYLAEERPLVAALEEAFLRRAVAAQGLSSRLIYDDQYLCTAGQLYLTATGRYRVLADLRAWLGKRFGIESFTAKPYDLAAQLVMTEAGVVVHDAEGRPLDAPLDTETRLSVVAYGSERLREAFQPHLLAAMEEVAGRAPPQAE